MYDKLLMEQLRSRANWLDFATLTKADGKTDAKLLRKAADAIEELSKQRDLAFTRLCDWCGVCYKEHRDAWGCDDIARLQEMQLPRWIPVTERLPEENGHYLVHAVGNGYCSTYIALWNGRFRANFEMPITHWMSLPEQPEDK